MIYKTLFNRSISFSWWKFSLFAWVWTRRSTAKMSNFNDTLNKVHESLATATALVWSFSSIFDSPLSNWDLDTTFPSASHRSTFRGVSILSMELRIGLRTGLAGHLSHSLLCQAWKQSVYQISRAKSMLKTRQELCESLLPRKREGKEI